jgi:succinate--hydroxymethylglutarate CoA-transferase
MRDKTGLGQHIDLSMMDATFATDDRIHFELEDEPDSIAVSPILDLPFGQVFIATDPDMKLIFSKLVKSGLIEDPTPSNADLETKILARRKVVNQTLNACETLNQFIDLMNTLDIPWGEVRDPRDIQNQVSLAHREMLIQVDDRAGDTRPMANSPYRFSQARAGVRGGSAHIGEHNEEVLRDWLELSDENIRNLIETDLLFSADEQE